MGSWEIFTGNWGEAKNWGGGGGVGFIMGEGGRQGVWENFKVS